MAHNGLKLAAAVHAKLRDNTGFSGVNCMVHLPASAHAQGGLAETVSGPDSVRPVKVFIDTSSAIGREDALMVRTRRAVRFPMHL